MTTDLPQTAKAARRHSVWPYVWMLLGAFSFAVMSALVAKLGERFDWQLVALVRASLALLFAVGLGAAAGVRFVVWKSPTLWVRSIAGSLSLVCGFYALTRDVPVSDVLTLTNMFPIWVAVLAWPLLRYVPSPMVWMAVACAIAGVVLIQQPHLAEGNFALVAALVASFTSAIAMLGLHHLHGLDSRAVVAHFSGVSVLFCLAAWFILPHAEAKTNQVDAAALGMFAALGVTATFGQLMLTRAFASGPPDRVSVVSLTQVAFSLLFDVLLLGRAINWQTLLGIALVMAPTAWVLLGKRVPAEAE